MKRTSFLHLALLATTFTALAYAEQCDQTPCEQIPYYIYGEMGASFSPCTDICASPIYWDPANEGYKSTLGRAPVVGFGFGAFLRDWLSVGMSFAHRSRFSYCKKQTPVMGSEDTPGFLGAKTRIFNFDNSSAMFDLYLSHTLCTRGLDSCLKQFTLTPYAGLGIGISKNTLYNLHTVQSTQTAFGTLLSFPVASIVPTNTINKFAWQAELGFEISLCQNMFFGVGYRYFNGGCFVSNNYIVDAIGNFNTPFVVPAWSGKFKTNEVVFNLALKF